MNYESLGTGQNVGPDHEVCKPGDMDEHLSVHMLVLKCDMLLVSPLIGDKNISILMVALKCAVILISSLISDDNLSVLMVYLHIALIWF